MAKKRLGNWNQPLSFWLQPIKYSRFQLGKLFKGLHSGLMQVIRIWEWKKLTKGILGGIVALVFIWIIAFAFFSPSNSSARNIELVFIKEGTVQDVVQVGRLGRQDIEKKIATLASTISSQQVELLIPKSKSDLESVSQNNVAQDEVLTQAISFTVKELGIEVDIDATTDAVLAERKKGNFFSRLISWSGAFFNTRQVEVKYIVKEPQTSIVEERLQSQLPIIIAQPVSASFSQVSSSSELSLKAEILGSQIDAFGFANAAHSLVSLGFPDKIEVRPTTLYPRIRSPQMRNAIDRANSQTAVGLDVVVVGRNLKEERDFREVRRMPPETYRTTFEYGVNEITGLISTQLNTDSLQRNIDLLFTGFVVEAAHPVFQVSDDNIPSFRVEGKNLGCCEQIAEAQMRELLEGKTLLTLGTRELSADAIVNFERLGIQEEIGSFSIELPKDNIFELQAQRENDEPDGVEESDDKTDNEKIVENIKVVAGLIKGTVILPGDSWSLNTHIGEPTKEKGFLEAPFPFQTGKENVIGGGIEQVASTLFNVAVASGMDVPAHQSLPVYDSAYPYGLDALVSWPTPNLIISNPTPFGILIWAEVSDTELTIDLYSTKYYKRVVFGPTTQTFQGQCANVRVGRAKWDFNDKRLVDFYYSFYFPNFGLGCGILRTQPTIDSEEAETEDNENSPEIEADNVGDGAGNDIDNTTEN